MCLEWSNILLWLIRPMKLKFTIYNSIIDNSDAKNNPTTKENHGD